MNEKINVLGIDILKEVENIGACKASDALSDLTGSLVRVKTKELKIISIDEIPNLLKKSKDSFSGMSFDIHGPMFGTLLLLTSDKDSLKLSEMIQKKTMGEVDSETIEVKDVLREVGNILIGAYLTALSTVSGMNLVESQPKFIMDKSDDIFRQVSKEYKGKAESVFTIETKMTIDDKHLKQKILLILASNDFNKLLSAVIKKNIVDEVMKK